MKRTVVNVWDKVAPTFGEIGPKYWSTFGNRLVELSNISSGSKVLDIGMGRGASLFPAANKVGLCGTVVGIDNSEVMVSETYKDILTKGINNVEVKCMDAEKLEFEDNYFDNVICGFGIGYLLLYGKLVDIVRVLKEGGQAGFSIWGVQPDQKWLTEIINRYLHIGDSKRQDIPRFDNVEDVSRILAESGFSNIKVSEEISRVVYKDEEEWWQEMNANAVSNLFEQIQLLGEDVFQRFKADVFAGLEDYKRSDGFHFNMPVIYAFGEK